MLPTDIEGVHSRAQCLYTESEVEAALDRLAQELSSAFSNANPVLLCVMNGGLIMTGKLATRMTFPLQLDYLHATRYRDRTSGSDLEWKKYPELELAGRSVVIIDDILDEGATLAAILSYVKQQNPENVSVAVLVDKMHTRKVPGITADFIGLEVEDYYVYGYGMDYKGYLRNVAGIYAADPVDCD